LPSLGRLLDSGAGFQADSSMLRLPFPIAVLLAALILFGGAVALTFVANIGADAGQGCQVPWYTAVPCLLGKYQDLAGGLFGAAGTILAGWVAWLAVRRQVAVQDHQTKIAALTFWQGKLDRAAELRDATILLQNAFGDFARELQRLDLDDPSKASEVHSVARRHVLEQRTYLLAHPPSQGALVLGALNDLNRLSTVAAHEGSGSDEERKRRFAITQEAARKFLRSFDLMLLADETTGKDLVRAKNIIDELEKEAWPERHR
jgi:hypothetical protein